MYLSEEKMTEELKCCICGKRIEEFDEDAIIGVPFGEDVVNYCSMRCMDALKI